MCTFTATICKVYIRYNLNGTPRCQIHVARKCFMLWSSIHL